MARKRQPVPLPEIVATLITIGERDTLLNERVFPALLRELGPGRVGVCAEPGTALADDQHAAIGALIGYVHRDRANMGARFREAARVITEVHPNWQYLLHLEDDIVLLPGAVAAFARWVKDKPVGMYGLQLYLDNLPEAPVGTPLEKFPSWGAIVSDGVPVLAMTPEEMKAPGRPYVSICAVHRELYDKVPPRGRKGAGYDIDWSQATVDAGYPLLFCHAAGAIHVTWKRRPDQWAL